MFILPEVSDIRICVIVAAAQPSAQCVLIEPHVFADSSVRRGQIDAKGGDAALAHRLTEAEHWPWSRIAWPSMLLVDVTRYSPDCRYW